MTNGWRQTTLGQICIAKSGESNTQDAIENGSYIFFDRSKTPKRSSRYLFDCEALIVAGEGAEFLPKHFEGKFDLHQRAYAIQNFAPDVLPRYVYHWLHYRKDYLPSVAVGATVKSLRQRHFDNFPIAIPPLAEQKRIVAILDEAFAGIAKASTNATRNLANVRKLFQKQLDHAFETVGSGKPIEQLKEALSEQPRNGWSPPANHHADSGTPVLTLSSVTGFYFNCKKIKFTSAPVDHGRHYWVKNGDLLLTRSNTPLLVGQVAIANGIDVPTIYPDLIMRMRSDPKRADTRFLYYQLRTTLLRQEIQRRAKGANPTMVKLGKEDVQTLPIQIKPLEEQFEISEMLDSMEALTGKLVSLYRSKLDSLSKLQESILHRAFSGNLSGKEAEAA